MPAVLVIGAGTMGAGIAQVAAMRGWDVVLQDAAPGAAERGAAGIRAQLDRLVEKGKMTDEARATALGRLRTAATLEDAAEGIVGLQDRRTGGRSETCATAETCSALAIEAVVERLEVKREIFQRLEALLPGSTVLATNTSSLSVSAIAEGLRDPSRVIGMHFFNPAPLMPLVEVIAGRASASEAVSIGTETARAWGKTAVRAKDTPGFIVNRVARGYYLEALRLLGEEISTVEKIDRVMKELGGFRMGPFELMDLVGLDVNLAVSTSVWEQMNRHARFTPHDIQRNLVAEGRLGRKTSRGFYAYDGPAPTPAVLGRKGDLMMSAEMQRAVHAFADAAGVEDRHDACRLIFARVLCAVLNEAALALEEGVASEADIDTAMKLGTNYPHGPLEWARRIGTSVVGRALRALNTAAGDDRYRPAKLFAAT